MLWPWILTMLTYAAFGSTKLGKHLPDPATLAEKTRGIMKPVTPERTTVNDKQPSRIKKFWTEYRTEIIMTVAASAASAVVATVAFNAGKNDTIKKLRQAANIQE